MPIVDETSYNGQIFRLNSCSLWYNRGGRLYQITIESIEIRRTSFFDGAERVALVAKSANNQEILDNLWTSSLRTNASPFLAHREVVEAFKNKDPNIKSIIKFAPHPSRHPCYSFSSEEDARGILSAIVGGTLRHSIDVDSIKSDMTHGNAFESACETLQVWDVPSIPGSESRVKFCRNINTTAIVPILEFDAKCLHESQNAPRGNEQAFTFSPHGVISGGVKNLKIAFATDHGRKTFLNVVRLSRGTGG
jgi:hypothetical protein